MEHQDDDHRPPADPVQVVAVETERYVARAGWDQPPRLFALVRTVELAGSAPGLAVDEARPGDLSAVEQEGFDPGSDLEAALAAIAWPAAVAGVALSIERIVLPPAAEEGLPQDPDSVLAALLEHPARQEVRLVAAVHRDGRSMCLLRQRAHDRDDMVATGPDLAPGLLAALADTLTADLPG